MLKQIEIDKYNLCGWRYLFKKYCVDVGYGKKHAALLCDEFNEETYRFRRAVCFTVPIIINQ